MGVGMGICMKPRRAEWNLIEKLAYVLKTGQNMPCVTRSDGSIFTEDSILDLALGDTTGIGKLI